MSTLALNDADRKVAENHLETWARSLFQIHGYPMPDSGVLSGIIKTALDGIGPNESMTPGSMSGTAIGLIDQLVKNSAEAGRPVNQHSAEAAREAQATGWAGKKLAFNGDPGDLGRPGSYRSAPGDAGYTPSGGSSDRAGSSARYDSVGSTVWSTPKGIAQTRSYALANDMGWVTSQPDLMRMGQPAIQALHEAKLQGDGYEALHGREHLNFDNKTIVDGAGYMKRNHLDYDEAAKAAAAVYDNKAMSKGEKAEWKGAVGGVLHSKDAAEDERSRGKLRESGEHVKKAHPEMTPEVDRALHRFHAEKGAAAAADHKSAAKIEHAEVQTRAAEFKVKKAELGEAGAQAKSHQAASAQASAGKSKANLDAALS